MAAKARVLATRRLPPNVTARLERDYDASLNPDDAILSGEALIAKAAAHDGILCCSSEKLTDEVIAALPESVRIVATFSVGYEHIDIAAAKRRGLMVTNTPDVLTDATADTAMLCLLGAARRGDCDHGACGMVARPGIEPGTQGFSVLCSTN